MRIVLIIFLLLASAISTPASSSLTESRYSENELAVHSLQKDETLSHLALSYYGSISFAAILAEHNNISDVRRIHVGQEIRIPRTILYSVKQDDVLSRISQRLLGSSRKYHIIAEYNNILNPDLVIVGQVLKIPLISLPEKPITAPEVVEKKKPPAEEKPPKPEEKEVIEPEKPKEQPPAQKEEKPIPEEKKVEPPTKIEEEEVPTMVEEKEKPQPEEVEAPGEEQKPQKVRERPIIPPPRKDLRLTPVKKQDKPKPPARTQVTPETAQDWPPVSPWEQAETPPEEEPTEPEQISPILEALTRWKREIRGVDIKDLRLDRRGRSGGSVVDLPMHSQLKVDAYKSVTIEYNKTFYFGNSDVNRHGGYYSGGTSGYDSYG